MSKVQAYVTSETCRSRRAVMPGSEIDSKPVSRHGDWNRWTWTKRETLRIWRTDASAYMRQTARAVLELRDWMPTEQA